MKNPVTTRAVHRPRWTRGCPGIVAACKSVFSVEDPDVEPPMACTIDHLSLHRRITVIRGFTDARGSTHGVGETGVISRIELHWPRQEIEIDWDRNDRTETLVFDLNSKSGPGNGRMRDYFEAGDLAIPADPHKRFVEGLGVVSTLPPELPTPSPEIITDPEAFETALARVHALAAQRDFDAAAAQCALLSAAPCDLLAARLGAMAEQHAFDPAEGVYEWLRDRAIQAWYSWGAQATSGGEGTARLLEIHPAMDRFRRLDRARSAAPGEVGG